MQSPDYPRRESKLFQESIIKVQASVIERMNFKTEADYVVEGYNDKCRRIMETDKEVAKFLEDGELGPAAALLTQKLIAWKPVKDQKQLAA